MKNNSSLSLGGATRLIDRLAAEHLTQRSVCSLLDWIASDLSGSDHSEDAAAILSHLTKNLPRHIFVEQTLLVPLLREEVFPEEDADPIIETLGVGQQHSYALARDLVEGLSALAFGKLPENPTSFIVRAHAFCMFHVALVKWEDETILRYARSSLRAARFEAAWVARAAFRK